MKQNPRIHIQHVLLSLQAGGLENGVVNIVNGLNPAHFRQSVCCLKQAGEFLNRLRCTDVSIHQMGWRGGIDLLLPVRLAHIFRQTKTDIVHTRNATAFFYGFVGAKLAGVPSIVHSEHGRTFDDRRIRLLAQSWFLKYTDAIFSVSEQLKNDLIANLDIPLDKIDVIFNGVDVDRFMPIASAESRAQAGIDNDSFVVGTVGRMVAVKNYPLLLRAVKRMGANKAHLLMVGDGPERRSLENLAQSLGISACVHFLGHRDDISSVLAAMDVFVLPSLSEGMSNTLLEAMASGIPVVASNIGGNAEIIRDGVDGLLFNNDDEDALFDRLTQVQSDKSYRVRLRAAGRSRVLGEFAVKSMVARYERLYQSVCDKRGI